MGVETGHNTIKNQKYTVEDTVNGKMYTFRLDSYQQTGVVFQDLTYDEYIALQQYQDKTGIQVIYPITDAKKTQKVTTFIVRKPRRIAITPTTGIKPLLWTVKPYLRLPKTRTELSVLKIFI